MIKDRVIKNPINGMESIAMMREIVLSDEKLAEQAEALQSNFNNIQEEMSDREFNPNLLALRHLDIENDEYEMLNKYIAGIVPLISTKKMLFECGIRFDNSELDFASTMFLNKDIQFILPEAIRRMFISFKDAIENGTYNDLYGAMYDILVEDLKNYTPYKYETLQGTMSADEYDDFIDSKAEEITNRMYKTLFSMGILIYHNGVEEAKDQLKELFKKYNVNFDTLIDIVTPEQLISEPSQFQQILSQAINSKEEIRAALSSNTQEIVIGIDKIIRELGEKNSISKFNQGNNMMGNVYPTINIHELIVMTVLSISKEIRNAETEDDLTDGARALLNTVKTIVSEKLSSKEVNMNIILDSVDIKLLSLPTLYVNEIVPANLALRALDGAFQTMCTSIVNCIGGIISDLIAEEQSKIQSEKMKSEEEMEVV